MSQIHKNTSQNIWEVLNSQTNWINDSTFKQSKCTEDEFHMADFT